MLQILPEFERILPRFSPNQKFGDAIAPPSPPPPTPVRLRIRWSDYTCDLAWFRLGVEPAELSETAVNREAFRVLQGLLFPQPSIEEKRA